MWEYGNVIIIIIKVFLFEDSLVQCLVYKMDILSSFLKVSYPHLAEMLLLFEKRCERAINYGIGVCCLTITCLLFYAKHDSSFFFFPFIYFFFDIYYRSTQSIGMLSYTFLKCTGKEDIVVPMVNYFWQFVCCLLLCWGPSVYKINWFLLVLACYCARLQKQLP